ncbi:unannotated protein [freshwater metagenome]|uniref:Unannotated protein n=1 Tax=freshwater metagenome TaxID=449393 RepID=A0A6J7PA15_9ZZZZ
MREELAVAQGAMDDRDTAAADSIVEVLAELGCLRGADDRAEVELGEGKILALDCERVAEAQAVDDRQVGLEEVGEHAALDDEARVGGAALLAVLIALLQMPGQEIPLREAPDAPRVQALLLEEVATAGVGERRCGLATVRAATDECERTDALAADEDVAERGAHAGDERDGQAFTAHERMCEGEAVEAALARGLRDDGVAGQQLHELGMHLDAHRVVPARDVAHRAGQGLAAGELTIRLGDVPVDAIERAIDIGAGEAPRLADLPDQQQREQIAMLAHRCDRAADPLTALVEPDLHPFGVLAHGAIDGLDRLVMVDARRAFDLHAIDWIAMLARHACPHPFAADEVADPVGIEGLRSDRDASGVGLRP